MYTRSYFFLFAALSNTTSDKMLSKNLSFLLTQPGTDHVRTEFFIYDYSGIGPIQDKRNFKHVIKTCETKYKTVS